MKTVAIIPGFAEGQWHAKYLRGALENRGYTVIDDDTQADIIIAHSAGCFFIPHDEQAQTIMLVGPPYWPHKPPSRSMAQKVWRDFLACMRSGHVGYWFLKTAWSILYLAGETRLALAIAFKTRQHTWNDILSDQKVIIVHNQDDAWTSPDIQKLLKDKGTFKTFQFPGEHDDIWLNPEPYIDLLQSN